MGKETINLSVLYIHPTATELVTNYMIEKVFSNTRLIHSHTGKPMVFYKFGKCSKTV